MIADEVEVVFRADTASYIANVTKAEAVFSAKLQAMQDEAQKAGAALSPIGTQAVKSFDQVSKGAVAAAKSIHSQATADLALAKASGTATAEHIKALGVAQKQAAASLAVAKADRDRAAAANAAANAAVRGFAGITKGAPQATTAIRGANVAIRQQRAEVGNLAAQFQDIGVQLAGGASPFTIISQQVPQIVAATGSVRGAIGGLGAALTQLISPVGLVSTAFILAASVAASYFADLFEGSEKSEKQLKAEAEAIDRIARRWAETIPALKEYIEARDQLADNADFSTARTAVLDKFFEQARKEVSRLSGEVTDLYIRIGSDTPKAAAQTARLRDAFNAVKKAIDENRDSTQETKALQEALSAVYRDLPLPAIQAFASGVDRIAEGWKDAAKAAAQARIEFDRAADAEIFDPRDPRFRGFEGPDGNRIPLPGDPGYRGGDPGVPDTLGVDAAVLNRAVGDAADAVDAFTRRVIQAESGGRTDAKNPNSSATGTGQFIASTWLDLFRRYYPERAHGMGEQAILKLREDANYSYALIQAYATENAQVLQKAGLHVDEAALQLAHFLGAGDAAKVLAAQPGTPLAGLISQSSINANPTILGGGRTTDDAIRYAERRAGQRVTEPKGTKSPSELFEGDIAQVQKRIDLLNAEIEATAGLSKGVEDYGYAVEKAKVKAELLNEAKAKELEITPELMARIDQLAGNYAKLSAAKQQNIEADRAFKKSQEELARSQEEFNNLAKDVLGGFITDLVNGKSAAEALAGALEKVASKLLDIALDQLLSSAGGGGGLGGFISSFFGGFKASGGPVSSGKGYIVGEKGPEFFMPASSGSIIPNMPSTPDFTKRSSQPSSGFIRVDGQFEVVNGNLIPLVSGVSGIVAGQQVKQSNKTMTGRLAQNQARGTTS